MHTAFHDATDSGNQLRLFHVGDDAGRGADYIHDIALLRSCSDGIPVGIEGADWNGNSRAQAQLFCPDRREIAGNLIGCSIFPIQLCANASQQWVNLSEEALWREAAERRIPHPLVAHGADAAL